MDKENGDADDDDDDDDDDDEEDDDDADDGSEEDTDDGVDEDGTFCCPVRLTLVFDDVALAAAPVPVSR